MFSINIIIAKGCIDRIKSLNKEALEKEGSIPGYILFSCNQNQYGYTPEKEIMDSHGDYWLDDWIDNLLDALEMLDSNDVVSIADPENYKNLIVFSKNKDHIIVSHVKAKVSNILTIGMPANAVEIWKETTTLANIVNEVKKVARELSEFMIGINKQYSEINSWNRLSSRGMNN